MSDGYKYEVDEIPLDQLVMSESNVRHSDLFADLDQLAKSIRNFGLQHPIVVRKKADKYEIIIGQRRYLAAQQLGWSTIPAKVETAPLDEVKARALSFSENIQRRDLAPRDKEQACVLLLEQLESPRNVAEYLGASEQTVRKWLRYAAVPTGLKEMVNAKQITAPQAIRLAQYIPDEAKAVAIARRMVAINAPKSHRKRIIAAAEESPDMPLDAIFRTAQEKRLEKRITVILPEKAMLALRRAAKRLGIDTADIARDAIIEWLEVGRY